MSKRLMTLQLENDRVRAEMLTESHRFERIRGEKPRAVSSHNLFQTPTWLAEKMVNMLPEIDSHPTILEPSAGLGRLYKAALNRWQEHAFYTLIDISRDCCNEITGMTKAYDVTARVSLADFLQVPVADGVLKYDYVLMNPPFKRGDDIKHIQHAYKFLKPSGLLVALCYNGVKQNEQLKPISDSWEVLPPDTFRGSGTRAEVVLLTLKGGI